MKDKPSGFLTYEEESRAILKNLSNEQAGEFFKAKARYFFDGEAPSFEDPQLVLLWSMVEQRLKSDTYSFYLKSVKNAYKSYCRAPCNDGDRLPIEKWFDWKISSLKAAARGKGLPENMIPKAYQIIDPDDLIQKDL